MQKTYYAYSFVLITELDDFLGGGGTDWEY